MKLKILFLYLLLIAITISTTPIAEAAGNYGSLDFSGPGTQYSETNTYTPEKCSFVDLDKGAQWVLYPQKPEKTPMYFLEITRDRNAPHNVIQIKFRYNKSKHEFTFWQAGPDNLMGSAGFATGFPAIQGISISGGVVTFQNVELKGEDIKGNPRGNLILNGTLKTR